ncbi:Arm DNA-binding domain-containing protein [Cruoricaptor ignavus]|uniref:Arm DNA-binding domain-containing protein n=1 Tax=Cruoricaptor ignavus TaxID=1118202 RepID=UPI00370D8E83
MELDGFHTVSFRFKTIVFQQVIMFLFYFWFHQFHDLQQFVVVMLNSKIKIMNSSIKIICKKTPLKNGLFPIYLRITINRKSKFYSTPFSCNLNEWDDKQGEFKSKYRNSYQFNKALRKIKDDASDVVIQLEKEYKSYNLVSSPFSVHFKSRIFS